MINSLEEQNIIGQVNAREILYLDYLTIVYSR
jgi:hypothetical protein